MTDTIIRERLERDLNEAEQKAWDSLARYKFQMFGYWAAIWVHLNRVGGFKRRSPFGDLVKAARLHQDGKTTTPLAASTLAELDHAAAAFHEGPAQEEAAQRASAVSRHQKGLNPRDY